MRGKATTLPLSGAGLVVAAVVLAGCAASETGAPGWTAQPEMTQPAVTQPQAIGTETAAPANAGPTPSAGGDASRSTGAAGSPGATVAPGAAATASAWKTYTDPGKTVKFELPQDWIAQSVAPEEGTLAGALKVEVKKPDGTFVAALRTGLPPSSVECPDGSRRTYTVISSTPVEVAAEGGEGTIPPRVVFRVIQGYRYFGSYGITNMVGGVDGQACELRNTVRGRAGKGDWSFGDLVTLRAFTPDERVAPAKAFDTLDQAAKYAGESEFANVRRMLMSLEIKN